MADWGPPGGSEIVTVLGQLTNVTVLPGGNPNIFTGDVRGYASVYLQITARVDPGTGYNSPRMNLQWFAQDPEGISFFEVLREDFEWWASTASPGANQDAVINGTFRYQDRMHGSFLDCSVANGGPTTIVVDAILYATTRELDRSYQQQSPYDDVVYENDNIVIGAGVTRQIPLPQFYGRLGIHRENIGGGASTVLQIRWGSSAAIYAYHTMISNGVDGNPQNFEIIGPRRPALIRLVNSGAGTTNRLFITTQRNRT